MGFAGASCVVHLSDGRRILVTETRDQVAEQLQRASDRWPLLKLHEAGTDKVRTPAAAHVVEPISLEAPDGR